MLREYYIRRRVRESETQRQSGQFTWVSRDGSLTRVRDMHDLHLLNTIRLLRRVYTYAAERLGPTRCGGHGFIAPEAEQLVTLHPTWAALQAERVRRELDELPVY